MAFATSQIQSLHQSGSFAAYPNFKGSFIDSKIFSVCVRSTQIPRYQCMHSVIGLCIYIKIIMMYIWAYIIMMRVGGGGAQIRGNWEVET